MEKVVLCFGDSNTYGADPDPAGCGRYGTDTRWPCALQGMLGAGWRVVEEGLPGRTTVFDDPVDEDVSGLPYLRPCLRSHAPLDHLVVMLGTNDSKERFGAGPGVIARGMERLLTRAVQTPAWRAAPSILLVAPVPVHPVYRRREIFGSLGAGCDEKTAALAPWYDALARRMGFGFLDAAGCGGVHMADGVHLTAETHLGIADAVAGWLTAQH